METTQPAAPTLINPADYSVNIPYFADGPQAESIEHEGKAVLERVRKSQEKLAGLLEHVEEEIEWAEQRLTGAAQSLQTCAGRIAAGDFGAVQFAESHARMVVEAKAELVALAAKRRALVLVRDAH